MLIKCIQVYHACVQVVNDVWITIQSLYVHTVYDHDMIFLLTPMHIFKLSLGVGSFQKISIVLHHLWEEVLFSQNVTRLNLTQADTNLTQPVLLFL